MIEELTKAIDASIIWFSEKAVEKNREDYFRKGQLGDLGSGAVYVYYKEGKAVYIGQASRPIKRRMHDETSSHKNKPWWKTWDTVKFVNMADETDRLTLELLLIIGLEPTENIKPKTREVSAMFKT